MLWVDSWSSGYDETLAQTKAAATISEASSHMFIYGAAAVNAQDEETRAQFESASRERQARAAEALDVLATSDMEDAATLEVMRSNFNECTVAMNAALTLSKVGSEQALIDVSTKVQPLAIQLGEMASSYLVNEQARQQAEADSLCKWSRVAMFLMIALLVADVVIGIVLAFTLVRRMRRQPGVAINGISSSAAELLAVASQVSASASQTAVSTNEETVTAFERIQNQMSMVTEAINRLGQQTQAVGDIITTVNDLAEQSKQAVTQVRTILSEIQKASTLAVRAAEEGQGAIEAGRQQIEHAGQGVVALADSANEAAESALQISASSRQQLAGMEQISQAVESITQAGSQSAAGTRQVEQEVKQLQDLAAGLRRLMDAKATT